jgi:hypothetical protein
MMNDGPKTSVTLLSIMAIKWCYYFPNRLLYQIKTIAVLAMKFG